MEAQNDRHSEVANKIEFLNTEIGHRLKFFDERRHVNRKQARRIQVWSTGLGVLITVVLGLRFSDIENISLRDISTNIALILAGLVTVINAWDAFFAPKSLWIRYTDTTSDLRRLWSRLDYEYYEYANDPDKKSRVLRDVSKVDVGKVDELYLEYERILQETNEAWKRIRAAEAPRTQDALRQGKFFNISETSEHR